MVVQHKWLHCDKHDVDFLDKCPYCQSENVKDLTIRELIKKCGEAANAKGWKIKWDGEAREAFPTFITLTIDELTDSVDKGWRDNDKRKAFEEVGDAFIRLFHIVHDLNIPLEEILKRMMEENKKRPYRHGRKII